MPRDRKTVWFCLAERWHAPIGLWQDRKGELLMQFTYLPKGGAETGVRTTITSNLPFLLNNRVVELAHSGQVPVSLHLNVPYPQIPLISEGAFYLEQPHIFLGLRLGMPYGHD